MAEERGVSTPGWDWGSLSSRERQGDTEWLMREALRRAVDIRDQGVTPRAVMLVDVLNLLKSAIGLPAEANGVGWLWADTE
jgi:hypothetical protein